MTGLEPLRWYCPRCHAQGAEPEVVFCPHDGIPVQPYARRGARWLGQVLGGRYRIERFVGAGGCAEVYAAVVTGSDRRVAVKLLNAVSAATPGATERFRREAQLISLVAHPNVVSIQDYGTLADGTPYMVMELLDGESLGDRLARGPLPPTTALRLVLPLCEGLAAAHERGVIHRDLKPDNLFLIPREEPEDPDIKILDLGIAKLIGPGAAEPRLTQPGGLAGTPSYMSPEQITGEELGPGSDVYSLGCVLWEMLLGAPPFPDGPLSKILAQHLGEVPLWPAGTASERGVPADAEPLLRRALAKDPARRPASMLELQAEIATLVGRDRFVQRRSDTVPGPVPTPVGSAARSPARPATIRQLSLVEAAGDVDDAVVEIAPGAFWVGRRHGVRLECNPYLLRFRGQGRESALLIDPGGPDDLETVLRKVQVVLGSLASLDYVFLNHQDPDVAGAAPALQRHAPHSRVLTSEDTWRLVRFYGLDPERFTPIESLVENKLPLATGHQVLTVPTPFCHFRGAVMLYDPTSQILFSGDLCGGATETPGLIVDEDCWAGIEMFHQIYMPASRALRAAVARIRGLVPAPIWIAPQHGALWREPTSSRFLDRLERLAVGLDLPMELDASLPQHAQQAAAANEILDALALLVGEQQTAALVRRYVADGTFSNPFLLRDDRQIEGFRVEATAGLTALIQDVSSLAPAESRSVIERVIRRVLERHGVVTPSRRPRSDHGPGYRQRPDTTDSILHPSSRPPPRRR